jgi:hypothetical protein
VPETKLSQSTWVPIGAVAAFFVTLATVAHYTHNWTVADALWKQGVDIKLEQLEDCVADKGASGWQRNMMTEWVKDLRHANPDLKIPDLPEYRP